MNEQLILVKKKNGEKVPYDEQKLVHALQRSGASQHDIEIALSQVNKIIHNGISTRKIYEVAYKSLKKRSHYSAGRYRLKRAMMELGPSGYPFEKFIGKIFEAEGYQVKVDQIVAGACVTHEVDVIARNENEQIMVECKYHSDTSIKSDVKVALYIHSRFLDVEKTWQKTEEFNGLKFRGMVVTNTRFSDDAMKYASCVNLGLISWDFPRGKSLKDLIDKAGYHPITSLSTLTQSEKSKLLDKGLVLCRDISNHVDLLKEIGLQKPKIDRIIKEAKDIIS